MSCQISAIVCCFTSNKNIVFFKDFILCQDFVLKCKKQEISSPQFLVSSFSLQGFVKPNQQCVCFNLDWFIVLHIYWCIALLVRKWSLSGKQGPLRGGAGRAVALPLFFLSWFLGFQMTWIIARKCMMKQWPLMQVCLGQIFQPHHFKMVSAVPSV